MQVARGSLLKATKIKRLIEMEDAPPTRKRVLMVRKTVEQCGFDAWPVQPTQLPPGGAMGHPSSCVNTSGLAFKGGPYPC
jgi:hypothetical protein